MPGEEERLVVRALSLCVQQRTFSNADESAFIRLHTVLHLLFPHVMAPGNVEVVDGRALLVCLHGEGAQPLLFLSHLDVVPAREEDQWTPFAGKVQGGYVHGRGTLDMKGHLCCLLTAAETLLKAGWTPKGDVWFAFSCDEEIHGASMAHLCEILKSRGVSPAFVLDEGGYVTPFSRHHKTPAALVGVAEKGRVRFSLTAQADVGAERLLRAGGRLSRLRFEPRLTEVTKQTLEMLAPLASQPVRLYSRHLNHPFCAKELTRMLYASPMTRAYVTSALALQKLSGDALDYERPTLTYYAALLHGDEAKAFLARIQDTLRKDQVDIRVDLIEEPSCVSPASGPAWDALETAINVHFPRMPIAPCLIKGGSDARRMEPICPYIYRFSPFVLGADEAMLPHHVGEKISIENLVRGVEFFKQMLQA